MKKLLAKLCAMLLIIALAVPGISVSAAEGGSLAGKTIILHTNDVHGAIEGYTYIRGLKSKFEKAGAEVILVDAGDFSQGTTYVSAYKGSSAVKMMNKALYNYATLGNHEFDYGYARLKSNMKKANFKVLCANVLNSKGKTVFDANAVYTTKSGVKIGFFGINTPESQTKANPTLIKGLTFLGGQDMYDCAQEQVKALEGSDVIICLSHLGVDKESEPNTSYDLAKNTTGIDMIIDGHSHTVMTKGPNGEKIQSTGTAFANIGVIVISDADKKIVDNYLLSVNDLTKVLIPTSKSVTKKAQSYIDRINTLYGTVFAKSEVELNGAKAPGNRTEETNNGDLITDSMIWKVMQNKDGLTVDEDHVVAITNGGGIRAAIAAGDVTRNNVKTVLPFGNTITVVYVKGSALLNALEASCQSCPEAIGGFPQVAGMKITIDTTKAYKANAETYPGSTYYGPKKVTRVTIDSINGKAFNADDTYAVITNDFCAGGGDTYYEFGVAATKFDTGVPLDEALMEYIVDELGGVIGTQYEKPQGRITIK
ncbi:MAG: bifunctional metallophosphatase/5'-nucleotidase [Lachnospiraceae bacterium]|nr:bifunctional metallophosphatase/5'-nucleotidase [Lachnospiraceae bacterium]